MARVRLHPAFAKAAMSACRLEQGPIDRGADALRDQVLPEAAAPVRGHHRKRPKVGHKWLVRKRAPARDAAR